MVMSYPILILGILKEGSSSQFFRICRDNGATGGTALRATGTVHHLILDFLGLHDSRKEVAFTIVPANLAKKLEQSLNQKLHLSDKGRGILFSMPTSSLIGNHGNSFVYSESEESMQGHQLIVTIVDRTYGDDVVLAAREVGALGATILHGRGTGSQEISKLFNVKIEPEKEVVLMVVDADKTKKISDHIVKTLDITAKGKGLLFTINVNRASGLFDVDA